ncbi:hypothetical protein DEO72_LG1g2305 [Vigna unguiculata]|uniref:Uncharacterized protein n=1 Tax=Vigna unguiculata TaxID=3917 RepID=A0A4D6KTY2_VIGUN|nr:hypothetical protein DEO72_LG1g2305 [Vigna unguiculata]
MVFVKVRLTVGFTWLSAIGIVRFRREGEDDLRLMPRARASLIEKSTEEEMEYHLFQA